MLEAPFFLLLWKTRLYVDIRIRTVNVEEEVRRFEATDKIRRVADDASKLGHKPERQRQFLALWNGKRATRDFCDPFLEGCVFVDSNTSRSVAILAWASVHVLLWCFLMVAELVIQLRGKLLRLITKRDMVSDWSALLRRITATARANSWVTSSWPWCCLVHGSSSRNSSHRES